MRPSGPLRRDKGPDRRAELKRRGALRRRTPLRRAPASPPSDAQRAKVAGRPCLVCAKRPVDPAHLVPRSLGGCDEPECVVPLCRGCHRDFDQRRLELLPHLEPAYRAELAHAPRHLSLAALVERVTLRAT